MKFNKTQKHIIYGSDNYKNCQLLTLNKGNKMKNKLLVTTAIAGIAMTGFASAETKVSGNLEQTLKAVSNDTAATSSRGFGSEYNIGLSSSADLDNGMTAKFGFNIESNEDGAADTGVSDSHYLTIGGDAVSFTVGRDNGQNLSSTVVPHVGDQAGTVVDGETLGNVGTVDAHNSDHARLDFAAAGGTFTLRYAPDDNATANASGTSADTTESARELIYSGNLGVDGLKVQAGIGKQHNSAANNQDDKFQKVGVSYNFGQVALGVERAENETVGSTITQYLNTERTTVGATFAANDKLSVGISYSETEEDANGTVAANDEEVTMLQLGYNMGGISVVASYAEQENVSNATGDAEYFQLHTIQKF